MSRTPTLSMLSLAMAIAAPARESSASVTVYTNKAAWQSAAGPYTTITFQELPPNTPILEQYANLGAHFTDGSDLVYANSNLFLYDGVGLNGAFDETTLEFDAPMTTIAMDFPGHVTVKLFSNDLLIYTSPLLGIPGTGNFAGLISTVPFDEAQLFDGGLFVDDLHFGPPIPAPGAVALLAAAGAIGRSRRRSAFNYRSHAVQASGSTSSRRTPP